MIELGDHLEESPLEFNSQPSEELNIRKEVKMEARLEEAKIKTMQINNQMGDQALLEIAREINDT